MYIARITKVFFRLVTYCVFLCILPELNDCDPNPCLNDGECVDGVQNYTCNCASFILDSVLIYYTGQNCSIGENYCLCTCLDLLAYLL